MTALANAFGASWGRFPATSRPMIRCGCGAPISITFNRRTGGPIFVCRVHLMETDFRRGDDIKLVRAPWSLAAPELHLGRLSSFRRQYALQPTGFP